MEQYVNVTNRLIDCAERRAATLARKPQIIDLVSQLSIRSKALSKSTVNVEIAALKKVMSKVEVIDGKRAWPTGIVVRTWMETVCDADFLTALQSASRSYKDIMSDGEGILGKEIERARMNGHDLGDEELIELLTGKRGVSRVRTDQKSQRHLDDRDLTALEMELSYHDPVESLNTLNCENSKARLEGTLRLFVNVMWFTGMRPTEVWNCILMVPRIDLTFTPEMVRLVQDNPVRAIHEDLMMTVEQARKMTGDALGDAARNAMTKSGAPSILTIKSAKTTNQNPELKSDYRMQILKNIPTRQLNLIAIATQCRKLRLSDKRKDSIRASMTRILKAIAKEEERFEGMNLNLYAFRHSFATRAKLAMPAHEAAALTGHTAKSTLHVYGERNLRKESSGGRSRIQKDWLPTPDPIYAEMIQLAWSGKTLPAPQPALS
ncbi:hypothetical protein KUV57_13020 [Epibacterium sp. DP7N7-1]|nr:hypothetical protein [Epibacterium sp. DP7N7-1]